MERTATTNRANHTLTLTGDLLMPTFSAEIKRKNGSKVTEEIIADTPEEALDKAAEKYEGKFTQIKVPHLTSLQKLAEWLKTINEKFEKCNNKNSSKFPLT